MTKKGWKEIVQWAIEDDSRLDLLALVLEEQDRAKQVLRDKGYGCLGVSLLKTAELVRRRE